MDFEDYKAGDVVLCTPYCSGTLPTKCAIMNVYVATLVKRRTGGNWEAQPDRVRSTIWTLTPKNILGIAPASRLPEKKTFKYTYRERCRKDIYKEAVIVSHLSWDIVEDSLGADAHRKLISTEEVV